MVNLNLSKLSALFAYDLMSVPYKPIPGSTIQQAVVATSGPLNYDVAQASFHPGGSPEVAVNSSIASASVTAAALATDQAQAINDVYYLERRSTGRDRLATTTLDSANDATTTSACHVELYDAPPILDQGFPPYDQTTAHVYRYRQQQSVNLGSWFVHENWMTPSVFKCASGSKGAEIDIANGWGSVDSARAILERHWDTFITESDFEYLANIGINTVRLPIGYWNLGPDYMLGTPFENAASVYRDCWVRIVRAINQAGNAGLGVLIDLHGAVGSQNGQPHSGVSDGQMHLFDVPGNMDKTVAVLTFLAKELGLVNNVVGIQLLNEPQYGPTLEDFYTRAIDAVRAASPAAKNLPLYLHDGFDLDRFSNFVAARKDFVVQDHHSYFVFSPSDQQESGSQHTVDVHGAIAESLVQVAMKQRRNLVVDEWSCALTPESLKTNKDADEVRRQFGTEQMKVYSNATAGWSFWSYKKEDCDADPGWCFTAAVGKYLPETFFSYGKSMSMKEKNALANDASNLMIPTASAAGILNLVRPLVDQSPSALNLNLRDSTYGQRIPHRFEVIHRQQEDSEDQMDQAMQNSNSRGYRDGYTTAKVFASYDMSRLGFIGQFMADAIAVAGPSLIVQGTEERYNEGFMQGLRHGEAAASGK